jgi:hypothetical protein
VLAAIEAAGMKLRAIDVGSAGLSGGSVADRMRRAIAGEGAERKLRREMELSPPDVAIAFDPHSAIALTSAPELLSLLHLNRLRRWFQAPAKSHWYR